MIIDLLLKKIPVVFITGRGETGLEDLKRDIYLRIKTNTSITDSDMKRIYVLTNDGARLFYSNAISQEEFLGDNVYVTTNEELNQLLLVDQMVKEIKNKLENLPEEVSDQLLDDEYRLSDKEVKKILKWFLIHMMTE